MTVIVLEYVFMKKLFYGLIMRKCFSSKGENGFPHLWMEVVFLAFILTYYQLLIYKKKAGLCTKLMRGVGVRAGPQEYCTLTYQVFLQEIVFTVRTCDLLVT